jgi:hypothetical protein
MERTWRSMLPSGVVGLVHPESHFTEARAGHLRRQTYSRLRRHWQFRNELKLFSEINNTREYGIHIYGTQRSPSFLNASTLFAPDQIDRSLMHDGSGLEPGIKTPEGVWDASPHRSRIILVDELALAGWAELLDEQGTPAIEARMLYPVNEASSLVLAKLAGTPRLGANDFEWTFGWNETTDRGRGYFVEKSGVAETWTDVILQGPHLSVSAPLAKQPNTTMRSQKDYSAIDLDEVGEFFIPRTNFQRAMPYAEYEARYPRWNGRPSNSYFRLAWRRRVDTATVRSLFSAIIPPGPAHMHQLHSLNLSSHSDLVVAAGIWASIPSDFLIKVAGVADITVSVFTRMPHVRGHVLEPQLILRTLRLNCLIREYAPLWEGLFDTAWQRDSWVPAVGAPYPSRPEMGDVTPKWAIATPLRRDADRRQALVEIDAIVAVMLGITADELATIYRTQFPVLQAYERDALYDSNGRQVPREIAKAYRKNLAEGGPSLPASQRTGERYTYDLPFTGVDREPDLRLAHAHFAGLSEPIEPAGLAQEAAS